LTSITGPSIQKSNSPGVNDLDLDLHIDLIEATELYIWDSPSLTDDGFGQTLKYFSSSMRKFSLYKTGLSGSASSDSNLTLGLDLDGKGQFPTEFLPGLSAFSHLGTLYLSWNQIRRLGGGQFQRNSRLRKLYLAGNGMDQIHHNSFIFDPHPDLRYDHQGKFISDSESDSDFNSTSLEIDLNWNLLSESSFSAESGLDSIQRRVVILLAGNKFKSLPASPFQSFLKGTEGNALNLWKNPLICDSRLDWLRNERDKFQNFVQYTQCSNLEGFHTVFTWPSPDSSFHSGVPHGGLSYWILGGFLVLGWIF
jgi:hypothetical protein